MFESFLRQPTLRVCAVLSVALLATNLSAQQPKVLAPHRFVPPRVAKAQELPLQAAKPDSVVGGLWMTSPGTQSTLHLKNVVEISAITVTPILYVGNGHKFTLPNLTLEPSGTATVDINAALATLGIASYATLSGYVEIQYNWGWAPICATIRVVDTEHSVIFTYGLRPATMPTQNAAVEPSAKAVVKGLWWKQESTVSGFVALSNTTSTPVPAVIAVSDNRGAALGTHSVSVSPHGTKVVRLSELQSAPVSEGGIDVSYPGPPEALEVNGGLEDLALGYSANLRFTHAPSTSAKTSEMTVAELGLMVGAADPMMLFPAGTTFTPYSVLRNISDAQVAVTPTFWWMEAGAARSAQLKAFALSPNQSRSLDVMSLVSAAGLENFNGSLNLVFDVKEKEGALLLAAGSVDHSNNYVFEVMPRGIAESASKSFGQWSTANGNDTMVTIWNPADEAQDFVFRLMFSGGHYMLPLHFAPRATRTFNISEIIHNQIPDTEGNVIPATVHEGSATLGGSHGDVEHILVAMDSGTYNVRKAICGTSCQYCDGYTGFAMTPVSATFAVQTTKLYQFIGTYSSGTQYNVASGWSSSNTPVATINSSGVATGASPGSANFITSFDDPIYEGQVCSGGSFSCPYASGSPSGGGTVTPSVSFSSTQVQVGQTATISATVTPSGNTVPISLSISGPAAIVSPTGTFTQSTSVIVNGLSAGTATLTATVSNSDGTKPTVGSTSFQVVPAPPIIQSISPAQGLVGTAVPITISGSGFAQGATIQAGTSITVSNVSVSSSTTITATFTIENSPNAGGNWNVTVTSGGQTSNSKSFFVQIPTSESVVSVSTIATGANGGCTTAQNYGIHIDVKYQVKDQNGSAIQSAAMAPQESVNNSAWGDIGPNAVMTTAFTNSDGTYDDAPVGVCSASSFSNVSVTQAVRMDVNGGYYNVRTNSFTVSGSSSGHGSISNGSDINKTR